MLQQDIIRTCWIEDPGGYEIKTRFRGQRMEPQQAYVAPLYECLRSASIHHWIEDPVGILNRWSLSLR